MTELFVPGRLCLFGEHSDWAGTYRTSDPSVLPGRCIIVGLQQGLYATASPADGLFILRQIREDGNPGPTGEWPLDPDILLRTAGEAGFDSYAAGTAAEVLLRHPGLGLRLEVHRRDLPLKKGLSSSAAVCVLTARAFDRIHRLGFSINEEMELAYRGEQATGSACGRMDQACAYGNTPVLLTLDGEGIEAKALRPAADLHLLVVDLDAAKDTRRILMDLNAAFAAGDTGIRTALGGENHRITGAAVRAIEHGCREELGLLMSEAQILFDTLVAPASPGELAAPVLHTVLHHPAVQEFAWGGKGVGSQGDGTAQLLCRGPAEMRRLAGILRRDLGIASLELVIPAV